MTQAEALKILKTGANVFLTGEPGSGKTHTVNSFVSYLCSCDIEPAITASTGIAATHIGGMTIHSWSGIGIRKKLDKYDLDKIASSEYVSRRVRRTRVLIIDEISMLSPGMLDMIDQVCREIKQSSLPFGGIQVILVGDFFQLPPIFKKENNDNEKQSSMMGDKETSKIFAYQSEEWERASLVVCYLSEQHRQDDADFLSVLSSIRSGEVEEVHFEHIMKRKIEAGDAPENTTKLFSHNINVDQVNNSELGKLSEKIKIFKMSGEGKESIILTLKKGCLSPENLELKLGAVVICTKNNTKEGFANGTLGTVIDFEEFSGNPIIKTKGGRKIVVAPMDWIVEENGKVLAKITQVPLRLAWAITVHKSQGMSLDAAVMDLSQVFEFGQGYVALSRVRRLSGLYLLGINERAFKVHPEILEKDIDFKKGSEEAGKVFGMLSEIELKKMHENFIVACGGKIQKENMTKSKLAQTPREEKIKTYSVKNLREKYPNAYKGWSKNEDESLIVYFKSGKNTKTISGLMGRQTGSIRARLVKLGLVKD